MSVGMANLSEIEGAFKILKNKTDKLAIMHCVSAYPTKEEDANLSAIYTLKDKFDCIIGQSDHTAGVTVPLYAIAAGAQIIEKHIK
nr:N-acetylneuraminate synthase family protein [Candidatus Kuenenia stuttgartiensis]